MPLELSTPDFRDAWKDWLAYRKEIRKPLKPRSLRSQLSHLATFGADVATEAIREAIRNQWQGLFPEKVQTRRGGADPLSGIKEFMARHRAKEEGASHDA